MSQYLLTRSQKLHTRLPAAWEFFATPNNLKLITPPELEFIPQDTVGKMYKGLRINYKFRLFGLPMKWVSHISAIEPYYFFVDEQELGPYSYWRHEHTFREIADAVEMKDTVYYSLPLGFLGRIAHRLFVRRALERIFEYRRMQLDTYFNHD